MGLGEQFDRVPHVEVQTIEIHSRGRLVFRDDAAGFGRAADARGVAAGAAANAGRRGRQAPLASASSAASPCAISCARTAGWSASGPVPTTGRASIGPTWWWAPTAGTRRPANTAASPSFPSRRGYDILWLKVPYPDGYPDRTTVLVDLAANRVLVAFPTADGQLQVGFFIPKGSFPALRARAVAEWTEELIGRVPAYLADHLRAHREAVAGVTLLNVVCGRLTEWTVPGLLLIGDAAHPMSPVGGQGVNIALRDALVAANHLCPVLTAGGDPSAIDAATRRVRDERWPEIVAVQQMQENQGQRVLHRPLEHSADVPPAAAVSDAHRPAASGCSARKRRLMSDGVVPVRLVV